MTPTLLRPGRRLGAKDADGCRHFPGLTSEVRADLLPTLSAVTGSPQSVRCEVEKMRINRREHNRLGSYYAEVRPWYRLRHHVLALGSAPVVTRQLAAENYVGVERIGHNIAVLFRRHGMPVTKRNLAIVTATGDANRAALLPAAAEAIGKSVVGVHVIHLRRGLVVPRTPGRADVHGDDGPLVARQNDRVGIVGIDPAVLIVIAAGGAAKAGPDLAAVRGFPSLSLIHI